MFTADDACAAFSRTCSSTSGPQESRRIKISRDSMRVKPLLMRAKICLISGMRDVLKMIMSSVSTPNFLASLALNAFSESITTQDIPLLYASARRFKPMSDLPCLESAAMVTIHPFLIPPFLTLPEKRTFTGPQFVEMNSSSMLSTDKMSANALSLFHFATSLFVGFFAMFSPITK